LNGQWKQGGFAFGRTWPRAAVYVDGEPLTAASEHGLFVVGFDRDAGPSTVIEARSALTSLSRTLDIAPGTFPESRIDGLPPATVEPTDPALLARIKEEAALKAVGFASRADADDFRDGFVWPLEILPRHQPWGAQRVLNGTPARPHYGIDLAAPQGTPIRAPADGSGDLQPFRHAFRGRPGPDRPRPGSDHRLSAPVAAGRRRRPGGWRGDRRSDGSA
jgi:hypothetical protein